MSSKVSLEELETISQVDLAAVQRGKMVCTSTFYTEGQWHLWLPNGDRLFPIKLIDLSEGVYFGTSAAAPHDLRLNALNVIAQQACIAGTERPFMGIWDDLYNIAASVAKLDLVTSHHGEIRSQLSRMVVTEVEYLAIQCRSIFDYLQKILKTLWSAVGFNDGLSPPQTLPDSFRDMVMGNDGKLRTAPEIEDRYKILSPLAIAYAKHARFFADLRAMRDAIVHKGAKTPTIFATEKGAYIESTLWPFCTMTTWRADEFSPNNLVPLKPALGAMVYRTLLAAEELITTLSFLVNLGPPICPNHVLFLRASSGLMLADLMVDADQRYVPTTDEELFSAMLAR
ncbi:hypothetical protein CH75_09240 [Dyella jiangningensis]|nr:hypothetical protein CH75_09240 [Dyella jiangningensis]